MRLKHIFFWPLFLALRIWLRWWVLPRWKKLTLGPFESYQTRNLAASAYAEWLTMATLTDPLRFLESDGQKRGKR